MDKKNETKNIKMYYPYSHSLNHLNSALNKKVTSFLRNLDFFLCSSLGISFFVFLVLSMFDTANSSLS